MRKNRLVSLLMAIMGFTAIGIGVYQGFVHVAPGYEGTIMSGWDGALSHQEVLLVQFGAVGLGGTIAGLRWKRLSSIPFIMGSIILFYTLRAVFDQLQSSWPIYQEVEVSGAGGFEGDTVMVILGAEPFLLAVGALLLMGAGIKVRRLRTQNKGRSEVTSQSSQM